MRNPFIRDATANESPTRLSYLSQAWGTVVTPLAHHPQRLISYIMLTKEWQPTFTP
jgi:hypothetical protein